MRKTYIGLLGYLKPHQIFVFGSNLQGRHGRGAALIARVNYGAIYGQAKGLQGQSYAIITKDLTKVSHPSIHSQLITNQITELYKFAKDNTDKEFFIAYSTEPNLNGYTPKEMAYMFIHAREIPDNIIFEKGFSNLVYEELIKRCQHYLEHIHFFQG